MSKVIGCGIHEGTYGDGVEFGLPPSVVGDEYVYDAMA